MKNDAAFFKKVLDNLHDGVYFVDTDRRITYWNKAAERITGYSGNEVTGKKCSDNVLMHSDEDGNLLCLSECVLASSMKNGAESTAEIYLRHKNGHRVPVTVRVSPIFDEQGTVTGAVEIFTDNTPPALALDRLAELERLAYLDPLTGIANRRYAEIVLKARLEELERYGWPFGVIFIDIDGFKSVNDQYGHETGDEVLRTIAKTLQNSLRTFDVISRWGGEEYLAVIANIDAAELNATANRCRALVAQTGFRAAPSLSVTVSAGATLAVPGDTEATLIDRVDRLMYRSKRAGRNRVTLDDWCVTDGSR